MSFFETELKILYLLCIFESSRYFSVPALSVRDLLVVSNGHSHRGVEFTVCITSTAPPPLLSSSSTAFKKNGGRQKQSQMQVQQQQQRIRFHLRLHPTFSVEQFAERCVRSRPQWRRLWPSKIYLVRVHNQK